MQICHRSTRQAEDKPVRPTLFHSEAAHRFTMPLRFRSAQPAGAMRVGLPSLLLHLLAVFSLVESQDRSRYRAYHSVKNEGMEGQEGRQLLSAYDLQQMIQAQSEENGDAKTGEGEGKEKGKKPDTTKNDGRGEGMAQNVALEGNSLSPQGEVYAAAGLKIGRPYRV